jgi:2-amino-4-hydroxy-6-hydroxymethyldihydropteridine diphosphokinase
MASRVFIALGSNLDHPRRQLARALRAIARIARTRITARAPNYVSAPVDSPLVDGAAAPDYVNTVVQVTTALAPRALLARLQRIERGQGRVRRAGAARNLPRTLDLDLLLFERRRMHGAILAVPHPRMHQRAFVLRPLADIAPFAVIPGRGLARSVLAGVRNQPIARTRTHRGR